MLKAGVQRKRTRQEIEEERRLADLKQQEIEEKLAQQHQMEQRISELEQQN